MRYVLLFWTSLKDVGRESERESARGNTNGLSQIPLEEQKQTNKQTKQNKTELLAVARLLFFTSNLLLPSTVYIHIFLSVWII